MSSLKIGVIIGRFQVPEPHTGHYKLYEYVRSQSDQVVFLVGVSPNDGFTAENPLTFNQRARIMHDAFYNLSRAGVQVMPLFDMRTNEEWSKQIDTLLVRAFEGDSITLYGGRDSFTASYTGDFPVDRMEALPIIPVAGTTLRAEIKEGTSRDFYEGQIYALNKQWPKVYPTVDIALTRENGDVLLIQRADSGRWCFPGGFVDPTDESFEAAAKRELMEETGCVSESGVKYVGSFRINDFRYRGVRDKITTSFFQAYYSFGAVTPNPNEVQDYRWMPVHGDEIKTVVSDTHQPLLAALRRHFKILNADFGPGKLPTITSAING